MAKKRVMSNAKFRTKQKPESKPKLNEITKIQLTPEFKRKAGVKAQIRTFKNKRNG